MGVTYVHLDRLRCFEITARRRTNLCNTINKLFVAAQSAAKAMPSDGQLGLYEINKGSLIAVSYPPIRIPNDNRFFLFYFTVIINQEVVAAEGTTSKTIASRTNIKTTKML